jgi:hypothetical protein
MPYIDPDLRPDIDNGLAMPSTVGELNYKITREVDEFLNGAVNYDAINEVIGVLECAKLELYRRVGAPYEDMKGAANGDVYKHRTFMP